MNMPAHLVTACSRYMHAEVVPNNEIEPYMAAAAQYIGLTDLSDLSALQRQALFSLTLYYFDHRDAVGNEADMPIGLRPILNRLKIEQLAQNE